MISGAQQQKVALLTGAATGIGNGVAVDLAMKGWKVVILDHNAKSGEAVALESNGDFYQTDVRSWKQQHDAFEATIGKYGRVDFVLGNAGIPERQDFFDERTTFNADSPPNLEVYDVNLTGVTYTSLLAISAFRRNPNDVTDALLVLTASAAGLYPSGLQPLYAAAKHGVIGLARSLGQKHVKEGFRVCALAPGMVPTTIMPAVTIEQTDKNMLTPISHIVSGVNDMLDSKANATVCEASVDQLYYRGPPDFADEAMRRLFSEVSDRMTVDFARGRERASHDVS